MTTSVKVIVPPHAAYTVMVRMQEKILTRKQDSQLGWAEGQVTILEPGDHQEFYIFSERRILIQEIPHEKSL